MDPIIGGALIGGAATLATGLMGSSASADALKWNKEAQRITWKREDNAVRRRAADLKAAGMSPLLAAGASAQTSPAAHIGAQEMPDIGGAVNNVIQTKMAMAKQNADISQTEQQTKLLEGQLDTVRKQNQLLQQTIDWYKDHPGTAPNIPGQSTVNSVRGLADYLGDVFQNPESTLVGRIGGRLGSWIGRKIGHMRSQRSYITPESKARYLRNLKQWR